MSLTRLIILAVVLCANAFWAPKAQAQIIGGYVGCISLTSMRPDIGPPLLARSIKDCIEKERYDDAMRVFFAYSAYGVFDQQRVRDESGHIALKELSIWVFGGTSARDLQGLRDVRAKMRDREGAYFQATCAEIASVGPPDYRPDYLIKRGEYIPRKTKDDWRAVDFDPVQAWRKALVEVNGCPAIS